MECNHKKKPNVFSLLFFSFRFLSICLFVFFLLLFLKNMKRYYSCIFFSKKSQTLISLDHGTFFPLLSFFFTTLYETLSSPYLFISLLSTTEKFPLFFFIEFMILSFFRFMLGFFILVYFLFTIFLVLIFFSSVSFFSFFRLLGFFVACFIVLGFDLMK